MSARSRQLGAFVAMMFAFVLSACVAAPSAAPKQATLDVRIGLIPSSASTPILLPTENGEFAAHGLNVSVQPVTDTAQAMVSVAGNQFEMGYVTMGSAALNSFNRGSDLKILAAGGAEPRGHGSNIPLIVRTQLIDSGAVKTVGDLRGRKVAVNAKGVIIEYALAKALAVGNLTANDVDLVLMPFPEMVAALTTGAIDAGVILQPLGAQAVAKGIGKVLLDDYNQNAQNAMLVVNTRFLEQHREAMTSFLEVYIQAVRRLSDGKLKTDEQALAVLQKYTNTPPEVMRLAPDPYWPTDGRVIVDSVQDEQSFFMSTNSVDYTQPMDIRKLIDYGPLDAALNKIGG